MDDFLKTWSPQEPVEIREFASKYFEWCETNIRPKTKVNAETLAPYGLQVTQDGKVIGIPKKSIK